MEAKDFLSKLCNHILQKSPLNYYFARFARPPIQLYLAETSALTSKRFSALSNKLVGCKQIQPSYADVAKEEFIYLQRSVVRENKGYFFDNVKIGRLDELCMRYLKGSIYHKRLTSIMQLVLVLSHVQSALKLDISLGDKLLVENM